MAVDSGLKAGLLSAAAGGVGGALGVLASAWLGGGAAGMAGAAAVGAGLVAAASAPLGRRLDRDARRLCAELSELEQNPDAAEIGAGGAHRALRQAVQGAVSGLRSRLENATARLREAEIRRRVSEGERQGAEAILHSLHDAVIVTDSFNELKLANKKAAELLGFSLEAALHKPIDEVIPAEQLRRLIRDERDQATPGHRKSVEVTLASAPGAADGAFDVTLSCVPDAKKGVAGVVTILRDVTREREINQMKSDFVSKVSHELRTPLSSINAYLELLADGEAQDEKSRQEFYGTIKSEADRLNRLIDNMLNISRIEAGIVKIDRTEVDFVKAARHAIEVMRPQAQDKSISIHFTPPPIACTAMADADMVQQVMLNLISNAVKYTPEGGRATVTVENDDATGSVMVSVADTGLGIPPDALPRLFEKFFRVENYKRVAKGTGLGLALVKHIVETVHHGTISVQSQLGMGCKFTFTIPYDQDRP